MPLDDSFVISSPNQENQQGAVDALVIEEYTGMVEHALVVRSVLEGKIPFRRISGTDTFTNRAVGEAGEVRKVVPGVQLDGVNTDVGRNSVTVDTVVAHREAFALLDVFLTNLDIRKEVALEQGKSMAKFRDKALFIQALKAALATSSSFRGAGAAGKPQGFTGGSQVTLAAAGDLSDPAKLYSKLAQLCVEFEKKDVDPRLDGLTLYVRPDEYYTLIQAEQLVNMQYATADVNKVNSGWVLKTYGVPVESTNNCPFLSTVASHQLSNAGNGSAYDGDFSKVAALAFTPKAVMAGEAIPLTADIFYDKLFKSWFVDCHTSFAAGQNRNEYAGVILLP